MEFVILPALLLFLVFCIIMLIKTSRAKRKRKRALKELKAKGLTQQLFTLHTYGLPVAEGVPCTIHAYSDRLEFYSGTTSITLTADKITDMCIKTETEIQQQYVSSVGGAVGGAVLFGPIGAIIGGRAKKKTSRTINYFLIVTYKKADAPLAYLGFDVSGCYFNAVKLVSNFHKSSADKGTHIDL